MSKFTETTKNIIADLKRRGGPYLSTIAPALLVGVAVWVTYTLGYYGSTTLGSPSWALFIAATLGGLIWMLWRMKHRIAAIIAVAVALLIILVRAFGWRIDLTSIGGGPIAWAIGIVIVVAGLTAIVLGAIWFSRKMI